MRILRTYTFGLLKESEQSISKERTIVNPQDLKKAQAMFNSNPSLKGQMGGKLIQSMTDPSYNQYDKNKGIKKDVNGNTTIPFGDVKTLNTRLRQYKQKYGSNCISVKALDGMVNNLYNKLKNRRLSDKSHTPKVEKVQQVKPTAKSHKKKSL